MALLLDTHAALWYALGDPHLSIAARTAIDNEDEFRFLSPATYWEVAIKVRLGNYKTAIPFNDFWKDAIARCGYTVLPIEVQHAGLIATLPFIHRDPFDRMLVAQALLQNCPLISNDARLDGYGVQRIW